MTSEGENDAIDAESSCVQAVLMTKSTISGRAFLPISEVAMSERFVTAHGDRDVRDSDGRSRADT
jgi:hypothetical protein